MPRRDHRQGAQQRAAPPGPPPRDPTTALQRVGLFADMDRRQAEQIGRLLKERRFAKGETVILEGSGGAAVYLIVQRRGHGLAQRHRRHHARARVTTSARSR